jgi:hypothetical protein
MFGVVKRILSPSVVDCKVDRERSIFTFKWYEAPSRADSVIGQLGSKF